MGFLNRRSCVVLIIGACIILTAFGALLQALNIIPDNAERTQTAAPNQGAAFNVTRNAQLTATFEARAAAATDTPFPTDTAQPTSTPQTIRTSIPTPSPVPMTPTIATLAVATNTPVPATAGAAITPMSDTTYYVINQANVRACTTTECEVLTTLGAGASITVNASVIGQAAETGNLVWYRLNYNGREAYVYSSLVNRNAPVVNPAPMSTPVQNQQWICTGDVYNCGSFRTCAEAQSYMSTCVGDPSNLDGDGDNRYCESICGG